jgi:hypothetical protein
MHGFTKSRRAKDPINATSEIGLHRMEIHVYLGGEDLGNNHEGTNRGVRGRTQMTEYHIGLYMEHIKGTRN